MHLESRNLFINERPTAILIELQRSRKLGIKQLSKRIDSSYSYTEETITEMEQEGLVKTMNGTEQGYTLTPHGKSLAESLLQLLYLVDNVRIQNQRDIHGNVRDTTSVGGSL